MKPALSSVRASHWLLMVVLLRLAGGRGYAEAPAWQTATTAAGNATVAATTAATDGSGFYLVSSFSGSATFSTIVLTTTNTQEMFVAK
ncbi:MAG: hypothetical protein ACRYFZ_21415 [Janthinobacterium lividum]